MSNYLLTITIATHNFSVTKFDPNIRSVIYNFSTRYVQKGLERNSMGKYVTINKCVYGAATKDRHEFRFHINVLKDFKYFLENEHIKPHQIEYIEIPLPTPALADIHIKPIWTARDYQVPPIEYVLEDNGNRSKMITLQPGDGKTFIALKAIAELRKRTIILVRPMYMEKWLKDLQKTYDIDISRIMLIKGSANLMAVIELAKTNQLDVDFIIISNKTFQNYIKAYEEFRDGIEHIGYGCNPDFFYETLQIGVRLIDEVHLDFHLNFKLDLYTNVDKSISLSATLLSNDPFMERMYSIAYPNLLRYDTGVLKKYVNATAVQYSFKQNRFIRTTEHGAPMYSHSVFEKSIMRDRECLMNYFGLIEYIAKISFFKDYVKGQRLAIFASGINMCGLIASYFKKKYSHLKVKRYVQGDEYDNLINSDIVVTTIQSGGTAHDIPNLTTVILTIAVDSAQANIQTFGRLRDLKETPTKFYYMVCTDIVKHLAYHGAKIKMLENRAASFRIINSPTTI